MRSETAARALFLTILALTLYLLYLIFKPFLPGIAWAVVLAVVFQPLYARLEKLLRGRGWAAATLLSALVAAFIVVPAVFAAVKVGQGAVSAYRWLEASYTERGPDLGITEMFPWASSWIDWVRQYVDFQAIDLKGIALDSLKTVGNALAARTKALLANAAASILTLSVMLVTMAVLFHEGPRVIQVVRRLLPLSEKDKEEAFSELRNVTRSVFFGVLLTAFVQAVLGTIGFAIVGLPSPITFGAVMFFCALIPAIGTAIVWGPAVIWLFIAGSWVKAVILLIWSVALVSTVDNFLKPVFIGRSMKMHMLLIFFGIFGGLMAFGLIGLFTGPLVITLFLFLIEVFKRDFFREESSEQA